MGSKEDMQARRAALLAQLAHLPVAMRELPHWLVWKLIRKPDAKPDAKPSKVPFYVSGKPRGWPKGKSSTGKPTESHPQVTQGSPEDRAALVSFEVALATIEKSMGYAGIGYAFLPGDGLIGVDIDNAIDLETGEISKRCEMVMRMCPSYTERSVSGTGVHIILTGQVDSFKSDRIGLEIFCGHQFFTCTGEHWSGTPAEPVPAEADSLDMMRDWVEQAKLKDKAESAALKAAAADGQAKPAPAPRPAERPQGSSSPGEDFKRVNDAAMHHFSAWVPTLFPAAEPYHNPEGGGDGYRVTSAALGRSLQEDLSIMPKGIHDWGTREGKSPIDLVVEWRGLSLREALYWLAPLVGVDLQRKRAKLSSIAGGKRPDPPVDGEPAGPGIGKKPPPSPRRGKGDGGDDDASAGDGDADQAGGGPSKGGKKREPLPQHVWDNLEILRGGFAYQYGSKIAWDLARRESIEIANLRHTFGSDAVRIWMNSPSRRVIYKEQVMFEPGQDLPDECLNLFEGLPQTAQEGDCTVMYELLRHLCSTSEAPGMGPEEIMTWVLRWCALPLQQIGAKLATALVFHGPQGTGKNLFFDVLRDLYGEYGVMVGQTELEDKYNTWLSGKMFIIGDEVVSRQEMYHSKNRLKWIVSQESKIPIRAMHADTRWESNHANLVFLSNESQPLALEEGDRRFLVVYTPVAEDGDLYARVRAFLKAGGARRFLHDLQQLDMGDFGAHTKPPLTRAKAALIELGYKPAERFMHDWLGGYLPLPMKVCSTEQLYKAFRRWSDATGQRFLPPQSEFTLQASRFAAERTERDAEGRRLDPPFRVKPIQVPDEAVATGRKQYRCWIPRGCGFREQEPPSPQDDDERVPTEGRWARECIDEFDKVVRGFMRSGRFDGDGDGEDGRPEPP